MDSTTQLIKTHQDLLIYLACICGVFGFGIVCAFLGLLLEKVGVFKTQTEKELQRRSTRYLRNHAYASYYNETTGLYSSEFLNVINAAAANRAQAGDNAFGKQNGEGHVNRAYLGNAGDVGDFRSGVIKTVAYDKPVERVEPKKKTFLKLGYAKRKAKKKEEKERKAKLMIAVEKNHQDASQEEEATGKMVMMENYDPIKAVKEKQEEEEETKRRMIEVSAKEFEIPVAQKINKRQTIEYENPMALSAERSKKFREQEREYDSKNKRTKVIQVRIEKEKPKPKVEIEEEKVRRILTDEPNSMKSKQKKKDDSFYY